MHTEMATRVLPFQRSSLLAPLRCPSLEITLSAQSRPFYDYVHAGGGSMTNLHVASAYPNYYGNSSPNQKYLNQYRSGDSRRIPGYNNYGFHTEMREVNNSYTIPQVCIEDADVRFFPTFFRASRLFSRVAAVTRKLRGTNATFLRGDSFKWCFQLFLWNL